MSTKSTEILRFHCRVLKLYGFMNENNWMKCFDFMCPDLKEKTNYELYADSLASFYKKHGRLEIDGFRMKIYKEESHLYENRPFALGETQWEDKHGNTILFRECWVKFQNKWYSRKTGLV